MNHPVYVKRNLKIKIGCYRSLNYAFEGIFFGNNQEPSNFSVNLFSSIGLDALM